MNFLHSKLHITTTFLAFFIVSVFSISQANAYGGKKHRSCKKHASYSHERNKQECGENPFSTEIISIEQDGECYIYEIKVTTSIQICSYDLSHYMFDPGCGTIVEAYNSEHWKMELNVTDPKTQVTGLKIDDISGFGKNPWKKFFYAKLKVCPDDNCEADLACAEPNVSYKAGQCIYYEEFETECSDPGPDLTAQTEQINPSCSDSQDGSIILHIYGGEKPYSISWNTGASDSVITNLSSGEYSYLIKDALGMTLEHTITLTSPDPINITEEITNPNCSGDLTGSIYLTGTGGTGSYSYQWSTGDTTSFISEIGTGYYSVMVTDENGCNVSKSFMLENQTGLAIEPFITQPSCGGATVGSIELEVMGGTAPYAFSWNDGSSDQNRYDLDEGRYVVTITDQNDCELSASYVIKLSSPINISTNVTHTNCLNEPIGAIEVFVTGGTEPYSYEWSNGETSQNLSNLIAGKYSILVTDANGCTGTYDVNINSLQLTLYANQTSIPVCPGDPSASVDLTVFFGTEPLTYEWSNGATTEDLTGITSGTYTVIVSDALGCNETRTIEVKDQNPITIKYNVVVNGCAEAPEYDVSATVTGGDGNYTYLWSNGETGSTTKFVTPGTYTLEVTDGNGCVQSMDVVVEGEPGTPSCLINGQTTEIVCSSEGNNLFTSIDGAVSYDWDVNSSDGSWVITSSVDQSEITYTAGNEGTTATFFLEVLLESGCTAICVVDISTCTIDSNPDNPDGGGDNPDGGGDNPDGGGDNPDGGGDNPDGGGDNPDGGGDNPDGGGDNPDGDNTCTDCFYANTVEVSQTGEYFKYSITINHNGDCQFDLSHLVISIPECAWLKEYSNSMGWKMERVYNDNKTGASGIKVDDISSFGKDEIFTSFEVTITLKSNDENCIHTLSCYSPEIAYKAGQCVTYEQTSSNCVDSPDSEPEIVTYPNPTDDWVNVCFDKNTEDRDYSLDLYDMYGQKVHHRIRKGGWDNQNCEINLNNYHGSIFYLHVSRSDGYLKTFKLCKK